MNVKRVILFFLVLVSLYANANAAIVQYDESVSGDINSDTFNLGLGINTISGNASVGQVRDLDAFRFNIAEGEVLSSFSLSYSNTISNVYESYWGIGHKIDSLTNGRVTVANMEWHTLYYVAGGPYPVSSSPISYFVDILPIGEGNYELGVGETLISIDNPGGSFDYTLSLEVTEAPISSVPIPESVWLFGPGFTGLIGLRRKKKSAI
ncbi:MAG: VPLPA-CTERM sorting domain-containing protein [Proteobacteria bacterium]|nr:VPLPA-CTERM sorting domain-containing protein [Pseudomonadota bacterium]